MHSTKMFAAIVAIGAGLVAASSSDSDSCSNGFNITSSTPAVSDCETIQGNVIVDPSLGGSVSFEGPKTITGDLIINNSSITGFSSSSLKKIEGKFELQNLKFLTNLQLESLQSVQEIYFEKLTQLTQMTFGSKGVSTADNITITDTRLTSLEGINIASVGTFMVTSNQELSNLQSGLVNCTDSLIFSSNGASMTINMTKLVSAGTIEVRQIRGLDVPALKTVGRLNFDSNPQMKSFSANNLTLVNSSLSFVNNNELTNFSFPALTKIQGDLTLINNTKLEVLEGLPKLKSVYGGIDLGGAFSKVDLPDLNDVEGTVKVDTTTNSSSFCDFFDKLSSNNDIKGKESCHYNNQNAMHGGDGGESSDGSSSGKSGGEDAAGMLGVNFCVLGLSAVAALAQFF